MSNQVEIKFWDVQHGHATYIRTPNDRHIVVDLGTGDYSGNNKAFSPLKHLKQNCGVNQLDFVIITHPHRDHLDDILNFDLLNPKVLHRPKEISNTDIMTGIQLSDFEKFRKYCEINDRYSQPIVQDSYDNINNIDNWGGLIVKTFRAIDFDNSNYNNFSIITVLEYAGIKTIIPGDNESSSYAELMTNRNFINAIKNADILLAPHHGRESGYNKDFINLVSPRLTVVSDGGHYDYSANNRYSQKSSGWPVYRRDGSNSERKCLTTNSDGTVTIEFGNRSGDNERFLHVRID